MQYGSQGRLDSEFLRRRTFHKIVVERLAGFPDDGGRGHARGQNMELAARMKTFLCGWMIRAGGAAEVEEAKEVNEEESCELG